MFFRFVCISLCCLIAAPLQAAAPENIQLFRSVLLWKQGPLVEPGQLDGMHLNMLHTFPAPPAEEYGWLGALKPPAVIAEFAERQWHKEIEALHAQGILVYASAGSTAFQAPLFSRYGLEPELYHARNAAGEPQIMYGGEWGKDIFTSCYANPHWRTLQRDTTLALADAGFDGIWFDFCGYYDDSVFFCQCEHCKESWKKAMAQGPSPDAALPTAENGKEYTQVVNQAHLRWRWKCWEEMWGRVRAAVKEKHPDFAYAQNFSFMMVEGRAEGLYFHTASDLYDYVHLEEWGHSAAPYSNLTSYLQGQAAGQGKPVVLVQNDKPQRNEAQHRIALAEALATGSTLQNFSFLDLAREHYAYQKETEEFYVDAASAANVAIAVSWWNKATYEAPLEIDAAAWMGQLLIDEHVPFDYLVAERDLTPQGLEKYRAILLPNLAVMSGAQGEALAAWVRQGGRLIATGATGTLDEQLAARETPLLEQLAGKKLGDTARKVGEGSIHWIRTLPEKEWWEANPRNLALKPELTPPAGAPVPLSQALDSLREVLPLKTSAARTTAVLLRRQPERTLLHLLNYNLYPAGASAVPDTGLKFEVRLPEGARVERVQMYLPPAATPVAIDTWKQGEDWVSLEVEKLEEAATLVIAYAPRQP